MNKSTKQTSQKLKSVAAAYSKPAINAKPKISGNPYKNNSCVRVSHREYLQDISGTKAFTNNSYSINPALFKTFPWLAPMASLFESYLFKKLWFVYEPTCGTSTGGSVQLAIDFDASDSPPLSKSAIMSYHNAVRCAPWETICYKATQKDLDKFGIQRYTRTGEVPNTDIKTYDVGNFFLATSNSDSGVDDTPFGELYVEYEIELYTPQTTNYQIPNGPLGASIFSGGANISATNPFGSNPTINSSQPGLPVVELTANPGFVFKFTGQYLVSLLTLGGTSTASNLSFPNGGGSSTTVSGANSSAVVTRVTITIPNALAVWSITNTALTGSQTRIAQYPQPLA